ncbi:MAG: RagB/SusD family nutrient uptake outer membrane protein [Bacteroidales bacterium]|nr:RagB/SusD family nutrient uptake outer membrane protein [Bacteroidales bacterium]
MKKTLYSIGILVLGILLGGCDKFFDINLEDQATLDDTMARSSAVIRYLAHCYSYIPRDENVRDYEGGVVLRSDESLVAKSQYETYWYKVRRGEYSAEGISAEHVNPWKRFYEGINECTTFIENVDKDKEDSPVLVAHMKAEARFLRAYYYFVLFRQWGPVVVWGDKAADQDVRSEDLDRATVDETVGFIVEELDKAIPDLGYEVDDEGLGMTLAANKGRITKGAAMALKARVLLYAASPLYNGQNGAGIYSGMTNREGKRIFPDYDATKWDKAATAALDVINLQRYELTKVNVAGQSAIQNAAASYQTVWFRTWDTNREIIWGWWFRSWGDESLGNGCDVAYAAPAGGKIALAGYSLTSPSLKLVDAYPMWENGRYPVLDYEKTGGMYDYSRPVVDPACENIGYKTNDWVNNYQQEIDVDPSWAKPFKAHATTVGRDGRFYANFVPNGFWWPSKVTASGGPLRFTCYNNAECTSRYSEVDACNRVGYVWRRLYKAGNPLKDLTADYQSMRYVFPAFRIAEIYLIYAEACNEKTSRNASEAIRYIDMVRDRAGLCGLRQAYPDIDFDSAEGVSTVGGVSRTGREWLRWMIRQERMCEFAMEGGQRHYDALRWMVAVDEYNTANWTLHVKADNYEDSYTRVSTDYIGGRSVFAERDYLFPFSYTQMAEMTNFTQNYGW